MKPTKKNCAFFAKPPMGFFNELSERLGGLGPVASIALPTIYPAKLHWGPSVNISHGLRVRHLWWRLEGSL